MSDAGESRGSRNGRAGRGSEDGDESETSIEDAEIIADDTGTGGRPCPICEEPLYSRHCKYVCPQHGVVYDCSDTFY